MSAKKASKKKKPASTKSRAASKKAPAKRAAPAAKKATPAKAKKTAAKTAAPAKAKKPAPKKAALAIAKKSAAKKAAPAKAKKPAPQKVAAAPKKVAKTKVKKPLVRRDGAGHLNPQYAADLRRRSKPSTVDSDARAFLLGKRKNDALADELGKEFLETVTSGEDEGNEIRDAVVEEEAGGPFVRTRGRREFGYARDASNPKGSLREPFPVT